MMYSEKTDKIINNKIKLDNKEELMEKFFCDQKEGIEEDFKDKNNPEITDDDNAMSSIENNILVMKDENVSPNNLIEQTREDIKNLYEKLKLLNIIKDKNNDNMQKYENEIKDLTSSLNEKDELIENMKKELENKNELLKKLKERCKQNKKTIKRFKGQLRLSLTLERKNLLDLQKCQYDYDQLNFTLDSKSKQMIKLEKKLNKIKEVLNDNQNENDDDVNDILSSHIHIVEISSETSGQ